MDNEKPSLLVKFKSFLKECWRVLRITKKPSSVEFKTIVKVSGLGMIIIGMIGFIIQVIKQLLFS
jgi:protein transport protein SEC61 subunit gamma-like protein